MTRRATLRASDADREQVAERLRTAAAEGRLFDDELELRLGAALSARTYGELDALVSDLPIPDVARRSRSGSVAPIRLRAPAAVALALVVGMALLSAVAAAVSGHSHAYHDGAMGLRGGATIIWLVLLAFVWRLLAHRRHDAR
jgi:hypothetical protein